MNQSETNLVGRKTAKRTQTTQTSTTRDVKGKAFRKHKGLNASNGPKPAKRG